MAEYAIPRPDGMSQLLRAKVCGIYFLWRGSEVVYVGQSRLIYERIRQHLQDTSKHFDGMSFIPCGVMQLNKLERKWIERLTPRHNQCCFVKRVRRDRKNGIPGPSARPRMTNATIAAALGLTEEQFVWLKSLKNGPKPIRIPRKNARRWVWPAIERWAHLNSDLMEQAKARTPDPNYVSPSAL